MTKTIIMKSTCLFKRDSLCLIVFLLALFLPLTTHAYEILMGTGEKGSFSHFTGKTICRLIGMGQDISCKTIPAPDRSHNLTNLRSGAIDVALVDSQMLHDAFNSTGYFKFLDINYENLRTLVPLYTVPIALVALDDAKINSLDDLQGKRINAGAPLSLQRIAANNIMAAKGWSEKNFSLVEWLPANHSQDTLAFSNGAIQAMFHIGVHPDPVLYHLLKRAKASLVDIYDSDIEKLVDEHSAFIKATIDAGTYSTNPEQISTFATQVILVTSEDLDDDTVTTILSAIFQNKEQLAKVHPSLSTIKKSDNTKFGGEVRPHRAAIEFFLK